MNMFMKIRTTNLELDHSFNNNDDSFNVNEEFNNEHFDEPPYNKL